MIDWLTFRLSVEPHDPLANGAVMKLGPAGEVEWTSTARLAVVGSYESSVFVRSLDSRSVEISGNPSKFFQGHNLWGSTDLQMLVDELTKHVCGRAGLVPTGFESLSRVDVTAMVDLGTPDAVRAVLRALGQSATMRHRGKGHAYGEGTVYWGKGSRRWSLKAYNKLEEITSHKGADPTSPVALISAGKLRLELTLRGLQLKDMGLRSAASWDINTAMKILREFLANLELPDQCPRLDVQELPRHLRLPLMQWAQGDDLRELYPRPTFYRYCKALKVYGVDVSVPPEEPVMHVNELTKNLVGWKHLPDIRNMAFWQPSEADRQQLPTFEPGQALTA